MATTYQIDPAHSAAHFSVRHLMITNVKGTFGAVTGTVVFDPANPGASTVDAVIDANSINTNEPQRDAHLKSADFLDVAVFPAITFKGTNLARSAGDDWTLTGDLTIHGVTKPVVLSVEGPTPETKDPWGNTRVGASATTKIKRSEFGLTWNAALETGGIVVGDDLKIEIDISLIKS